MANPFFTIGHSTRSLEAFIELLRESRIDRVVDVRSIPRSRTNPQFNSETLADGLAPSQISYEHIPELGGLRGKQRVLDVSPNDFWRIRSFRNYADYALTPPFAMGLTRLIGRGVDYRCAIMCAEAVWWRCHRRLIADRLLTAGERVFHILGPAHVDKAELNPAAIVRPDGTIVYPANP